MNELTDRQLEVARLIWLGFSNAEIAAALVITLGTVKRHVHEILQELDEPGRSGVVLRYERWQREQTSRPAGIAAEVEKQKMYPGIHDSATTAADAQDVRRRSGDAPRRNQRRRQRGLRMLLPASLLAKSLIGGVLMLGVGGAATAILVTSGPLAGDDDNQPALQAEATPTPPATATPTLSSTPLPEVTPTRQPATPTAPAQAQLDADGWPVIECPGGSAPHKYIHQRITICVPAGWIGREQLWDGKNGEPPEFYAVGANWRSPDDPALTFSLRVISKRSQGNRSTLEPLCDQKTETTLLGYAALRCDATWQDTNGTTFYPVYGWYSYVFAETPDFWIASDATGTERDLTKAESERSEAIGHLLGATQNGLEEVQPTAPAQVQLDADGWPVVQCPEGSAPHKYIHRRLTICVPEGWIGREQVYDGREGSPPNFYASGANWRSPNDTTLTFSLGLVSRKSSGERRSFEPRCDKKTETTLLGFPAVRCDATWQETNGTIFYPLYGWYSYVFAETADYWITADATGPKTDLARAETERELAVGFLLGAKQNGLEEVQPTAPAQAQLDADGWPVVQCAPSTAPYKLVLRRVSLCVPTTWTARDRNPQGLTIP